MKFNANNRKKFLSAFRSVIAAVFGLFLGLCITALAGENPWHVLKILTKSAFGSPYDLGMTLFYSTPLIFTGLAVSIPLQAGLFNVGAEGQLTMGALSAAAFGILFPHLTWPMAPLLGGVCAFLGGAIWGFIPGWLRAKRGSHEVINTIMLNFIAAGISSWVILYLLKNPESQNPETQSIGSGYFLSHLSFFHDAPLSSAFLIALMISVAIAFFFSKTVLGYEIQAVGQNENAAKEAGIDPSKIRILVMTLAGGVAGLVGLAEVLGNSGRFKIGFSPDYGFIGIAVALLVRGDPSGVIFSGLLFGALHKGTADLDMETENVTRDLSYVLQALVILSVVAEGFWDKIAQKITQNMKGKSHHG